jgi:hypothetical protein
MAKELQVSASGLCIINKRLIISVSVNDCWYLCGNVIRFVDTPKELTVSNTTRVSFFQPFFLSKTSMW